MNLIYYCVRQSEQDMWWEEFSPENELVSEIKFWLDLGYEIHFPRKDK